MSKRKAGENGMAEYVDYLNNYDRKARGAGSEKKPPTDRLSALDINRVFEKGYEDFGHSKRDSAREVLKYASRVEDDTRMGGGSERALARLRRIANGRVGDGDDKPNKPNKPNKPDKPDKPDTPPSGGGGGNNGTINIDTGADQNIGGRPPGNDGGLSYGDVSQMINQDNDIVNTITGNNNTVTNNQDNSISQEVYGSSSRNYTRRPGIIFEAPDPTPYNVDEQSPTPDSQGFLRDFMSQFNATLV